MQPKNISNKIKKKLERFQILRKEKKILKYYYETPLKPQNVDKFVVIDGIWGNIAHWNRVRVAGKALIEHHEANAIAIVKDEKSKSILRKLGINTFWELSPGNYEAQTDEFIKNYWSKVKTGKDILDLNLPLDVPSSRLYDYILKKQRLPSPDLSDKNVINYVRSFVSNSYSIAKLFEAYNVCAVQCSHTIGDPFSALIWISLKNNVVSYISDNLYGKLRLSKISNTEGYYRAIDCPDPLSLEQLSEEKIKSLTSEGELLIQDRFEGNTTDVAGQFAYSQKSQKISKEDLCKMLNWDPEKPINMVMMSNWFDYPHTFKLDNFENIIDWYEQTLDFIKKDTKCNWLFKPHPAEHRWYGGPSVTKEINQLDTDHIKVFPESLKGPDVLEAVNSLISPYGTCGVEYAAAGKTVLLAERSFYTPWNFCISPESKDKYFEYLSKIDEIKLESEQVKKARLFSRCYFGTPNDKLPFVYPCDAERENLYNILPGFYKKHNQEIVKEAEIIKKWLTESNLWSYHNFKFVEF